MKDLDAEARRRLRRGDFALPPDKEGRRRGFAGRYPIQDEAHARNALARAMQQLGKTLTRTEVIQVIQAVHRKYPDIELSDELREMAHIRR